MEGVDREGKKRKGGNGSGEDVIIRKAKNERGR